MNILLSILTFPFFISLYLYISLLDKFIQPLYLKFMNLICKLNFSLKLLLLLGHFFVYLEKTKEISYKIIIGNKDIWWVWINFLDY